LSLRKSLKRIGSKVQEKAKDVGRQVQSVAAKAVVPMTAITAGAMSVMFGPGAGAAVSGVGAGWGRVLGATAARKEGLKGMEARTEGRELSQRAFKYGMILTGAGTGIAGGIGALGGVAGGGGVLGGLTGGISNLFGVGGGAPATGWESGGYLSELYTGQNTTGLSTVPGGGWEPGGYLSNLYGSGANVSGTALEAGSGWGSLAQGLLGAGTKLGQAYLTPQQQAAQQQGTGGGFFENLFNTTPGSGVDLPIVGEVPTGLLILGGVAVLALTAK